MKFFASIVCFLITVCITNADAQPIDSCFTHNLPTIHFKKSRVKLAGTAKAGLDSVVQIFKRDTLCRIKVTGNAVSSEEGWQISWDKVAVIINYLTQQGINKSRFIFNYGEDGDINFVSISSTNDDGPNWLPAPIPCFSYLKLTAHRCKHPHR